MPKGKRGQQTSRRADLSPLELEVMNVVWQIGECSSATVIEAFNRGRDRELAATTIRTVLSNIREKGYLEVVPSVERGYRFRPAVQRREVARRSLRQVVGRLFEGSSGAAILELLGDEPIDEQELAAIRRRLEAAERASHGGDDEENAQ